MSSLFLRPPAPAQPLRGLRVISFVCLPAPPLLLRRGASRSSLRSSLCGWDIPVAAGTRPKAFFYLATRVARRDSRRDYSDYNLLSLCLMHGHPRWLRTMSCLVARRMAPPQLLRKGASRSSLRNPLCGKDTPSAGGTRPKAVFFMPHGWPGGIPAGITMLTIRSATDDVFFGCSSHGAATTAAKGRFS